MHSAPSSSAWRRRRTESAWAGRPSASASVTTCGPRARSASGVDVDGVDVLAKVVGPQALTRSAPFGWSAGRDSARRGSHPCWPATTRRRRPLRRCARRRGAGARRPAATMSCRCSGATAFVTATASSGPSTRQAIPAGGEGRLEVGPPARCRHNAVHLGRHGRQQITVPGHQPGQPVRSVLGLHHQVDGGEGRRGSRRGHHDDLGGSGERRGDAHDAGHLTLGLGDVGVARDRR